VQLNCCEASENRVSSLLGWCRYRLGYSDA